MRITLRAYHGSAGAGSLRLNGHCGKGINRRRHLFSFYIRARCRKWGQPAQEKSGYDFPPILARATNLEVRPEYVMAGMASNEFSGDRIMRVRTVKNVWVF